MSNEGPVLRVFEVKTKPGAADVLLEKFATTSAAVVRGEPGNRGHFFGRCIEGDGDTVMFVSLWADLDAVKARFGSDWQSSYLPEGYAELIESCAVRHFDMAEGWHVSGSSGQP